MNRELRRERTRNKWISRARKIYNSWGTFDVPIRGIKHSTTPWRSKMHQYDVKKENRKKLYEAKKIIKEECEDYV